MLLELRWLRRLGWLLIAGIGALLLFIAAGVFDPMPVGNLAWREDVQTAVSIPTNLTQPILLHPASHSTPLDNFTVRLTAAWQQGELDSGIGLLVGQTAVWVAPTGYLAVQSDCNSSAICAKTVLPWQWWPHVRQEADANEIWLAVENGRLSIRINREWLEIGEVAAAGGKITVIGENFGEETAVYQLQTIELFTHR